MRNALSLTLVLLAAMSAQAASACELSAVHHPLQVLLRAAQHQAEQSQPVELGTSSPAVSSQTTLVAGGGLPTLATACTEPASRGYERAHVAGLPNRGP